MLLNIFNKNKKTYTDKFSYNLYKGIIRILNVFFGNNFFEFGNFIKSYQKL